MVCCGCSFLRAQKNWSYPLLFKDFRRRRGNNVQRQRLLHSRIMVGTWCMGTHIVQRHTMYKYVLEHGHIMVGIYLSDSYFLIPDHTTTKNKVFVEGNLYQFTCLAQSNLAGCKQPFQSSQNLVNSSREGLPVDFTGLESTNLLG